ncbi:MAG: UxaA family hydrolase [Verrucomicrobia bacterium]|nr:UxaA family hydrolase [Verrucomicrobiota bacterium]
MTKESKNKTARTDRRLLLISPEDNVFVAVADIDAGETFLVNGAAVPVPIRIPLGHKVAARGIPAGEKVVKYGAAIGSATRDISAGDHVHTHNLKSDYLPTYARAGRKSYVQRH